MIEREMIICLKGKKNDDSNVASQCEQKTQQQMYTLEFN